MFIAVGGPDKMIEVANISARPTSLKKFVSYARDTPPRPTGGCFRSGQSVGQCVCVCVCICMRVCVWDDEWAVFRRTHGVIIKYVRTQTASLRHAAI